MIAAITKFAHSDWPFLFFLTGFAADLWRRQMMKGYLAKIGRPVSTFSRKFQEESKKLPEGRFRKEVRLLDRTSSVCWVAYLALALLAYVKK